MKKNELRGYQQDVIKVIMSRIQENAKEIFIEIPTGAGKSVIIKNWASELNKSDKILILEATKTLEEQQSEFFKHNKAITVSTYNQEIDNPLEFNYVILNDSHRISEEKYKNLTKKFCNAIFIFFSSISQILDKKREGWLSKKTKDYVLTLKQMIKEGYVGPNIIGNKFESVVEKIVLEELEFNNVQKDVVLKTPYSACRIDFFINNYNRKALIEVKAYSNKFVQSNIIDRAIGQVRNFRDLWEKTNKEEIDSILIVSCQIEENVKEEYYKNTGIQILDISNLLYLTHNNSETQKELIESIQYDTSEISPQWPTNSSILQILKDGKTDENNEIIQKTQDYIERLLTIDYGKTEKQYIEYEKLCVEIIKFLFDTEFTKIKPQSRTKDGMFRRDLICGIKGTTEFWRIFIEHYNTRFVVFEFKNYEDEIDQNAIYITEKYLYNAVLRNVAIIISRNGFADNARIAAKGALTEDRKLIIDIKDEDLINMLRMKADGQDASDYMLNKLEEYLISISK